MAIDKRKYISKFIDEGLENLSLIESLVFDIKDGISVDDDLATLLRALHTLKGTSRMLEFRQIENLSHSLEGVFIALREKRIGFSENAVKLILSSLDILKSAFSVIQETNEDTIEIQEYEKNLISLAANEEFSVLETDRRTGKQADVTSDAKQSIQENFSIKNEKTPDLIESSNSREKSRKDTK